MKVELAEKILVNRLLRKERRNWICCSRDWRVNSFVVYVRPSMSASLVRGAGFPRKFMCDSILHLRSKLLFFSESRLSIGFRDLVSTGKVSIHCILYNIGDIITSFTGILVEKASYNSLDGTEIITKSSQSEIYSAILLLGGGSLLFSKWNFNHLMAWWPKGNETSTGYDCGTVQISTKCWDNCSGSLVVEYLGQSVPYSKSYHCATFGACLIEFYHTSLGKLISPRIITSEERYSLFKCYEILDLIYKQHINF